MDGTARSMKNFDPAFADGLTAQWGHGPRVFRNVLRAPFFDDRDFMTALRGTAREYMADPGARVPPGRLYLNGAIVTPQQAVSLLPRAAEACDQYVSRIVEAHPGDGIGIVLDNCEKHVPMMRDGLVPVFHQLFSRVGYPARRNHLCIYAGNYRSTPFGIHRDDCHVLMFCGVGRKVMAFWPRPYFEEKKELLNGTDKVRAPVKDHISQATVLEIGPLDALYWSDDDWHVAVSETDDFQAALSVGLYHQGWSGELMTSLETIVDVTRIERPDIPGLPAAADGKLSVDDLRTGQMAEFFARWQRLRDLMNQPEELDFRALRVAVRLISSAGYRELRAPSPAAPELAGRVLSCAVRESLVVAPVRGGLLIGANGSAFFYDRAVPAIEALILSLRRGTPHHFDQMIGAVDAASGEILGSVVRDLVGAGALTVQSTTDSVTRATGMH